MQMVNALFLRIVEMSLTAGIVIGVVLFVRLLFRRLPRRFAYVLWIVVAFRLAVPVSINSDISIFNLFAGESIGSGTNGSKVISAKQDAEGDHADDTGGQIKQEQYVQSNAEADAVRDLNTGADEERHRATESNDEGFSGDMADVITKNDSTMSVMALCWIAGMLAFMSYTVAASIRVRRRIRYSIRLYDNVYACDKIRSPFVFGIFSPKIYLPFRLSETEQQCILAHEMYHILRRDYLVKSAAYVLAVVYWFQPLVWVAYRLMCFDMEMSCDEKIISGFTSEMRKEYGRLLLAFAMNKRQFPVSSLAFGEESTMKRVRNILNYKKTAQWKLAGGAVAVMLTMAACATDANTNETAALETDGDVSNEVVIEQVHHTIEHHQAQWAANSKFDLEFYSLDYADSDKIIFHISSGLFQYDLKEQRITRSIDLKALNCQAVQTGGECRLVVYRDDESRLRAAITPYPYSDGDGYIYDFEGDELFAYDASLLDNFGLFDGFVSKYDLTVEEALGTWKTAENVLPLDDHSYGALCWGPGPDLANMYYAAGGQKWQIFQKDQATLPDLLRQDDSFYQSFSMYSGQNISQCLLDYKSFYNIHDYAGVCALSTGLEYSEEMQQAFCERSDELLSAEEVSCSDDEKEYLFQFSYTDETGENEQKVYVTFKYLENEGWRAEGLPTIRFGNE